tara:strand:- start:2123 stop:2383 length:261 start_codon:yes stop_codon:yes gene_type:complete
MDSIEPKLKISAFMFFVKLNKEKIKKELIAEKMLSVNKIGRRLGEVWKNLEEKNIYTELADKDRQRYKDEMKKFRKLLQHGYKIKG